MDSPSMPGKLVDQPEHIQTVVAKPRLKWTRSLHDRFVDAVSLLGGAEKATPKSVMRIMGVPGLTLYHLKSHLQKYRLAQSQNTGTLPDSDKKEGYRTLGLRAYDDPMGAEIDNMEYTTAFNESMVQMQLDVQKRLQEQIEVQKHLQLRIEAQGKYLQSVLEKAEETLAAYHLNPTIALHQQDKDYSNDSCITASEKSEKKSCNIVSGISVDDQSEDISLGDTENHRGIKRRSWAHESHPASQSKRTACTQEQRSPEAPVELFDLNL